MNFIKQVKTELISKKERGDCCTLSLLYGIILACGSVGFENKQSFLEITTANSEVFEKINEIVDKLYGGYAQLDTDEDSSLNHTTYLIRIDNPYADKILTDLEILRNGEFDFSFNENIVSNNCCKTAFVKGIFLASASSTIKIGEEGNRNAGYHLEFVLQNEKVADFLSSYLAQNFIIERTVYRGSFCVIYLSDYESILTLIGLLGANNAYLALEGENVRRDVNRQVNRQVNFVNANLNKLASVSAKQILAIKEIDAIIGIRTLPFPLYEVAKARLENPEASSAELASKIGSNITKSGINHRLRKITQIAESLKN